VRRPRVERPESTVIEGVLEERRISLYRNTGVELTR
jgi:hypothetical protein